MTARIRRVVLLACTVLLGALFVLALGWADPAAAHDCSGPLDCEQTGGYNGIIAVVGGAAAVAAAAGAAIAATPEGEETDLVIVQVSEDQINVELGEDPVTITLTGWHVGPDGRKQVPMDFVIAVPDDTSLQVAPTSGTSELDVAFSLEEATDEDAVDVEVTGTWDGKSASVTVHVTLGSDLELFLE